MINKSCKSDQENPCGLIPLPGSAKLPRNNEVGLAHKKILVVFEDFGSRMIGVFTKKLLLLELPVLISTQGQGKSRPPCANDSGNTHLPVLVPGLCLIQTIISFDWCHVIRYSEDGVPRETKLKNTKHNMASLTLL